MAIIMACFMPMEAGMAAGIGRRQFVAYLGSAAVSSAHAQSWGQPRIVAVLMGLDNDAEAKGRIQAFEKGLKNEGWVPGQNLRLIYRFAAGDPGNTRAMAGELAQLRPDLIVGHSTPVVAELLNATQTIPVVFVVVADPVGSGFAESIPRPGGNATGFTNLDATISGKLLTVLRQIAPDLKYVSLLYNPDTVTSAGLQRFYVRPFDVAASSFAIEAVATEVRNPSEIERHFDALGRVTGAGLIVLPDNFTTIHRRLIIRLASQHHIPAIYPYRYFADAGGLMSYGVNVTDLFRRAAEYVSRILRGANPGDLPIQAPTKFELAINLRAAKTLGLRVPRVLRVGADALIE